MTGKLVSVTCRVRKFVCQNKQEFVRLHAEFKSSYVRINKSLLGYMQSSKVRMSE